MAEEAQVKVQEAVNKLMNDLDKDILRDIQREMHMCSAKCCDDKLASMETVHRCMERCAQPANRAQESIHKELNEFQNRLERCVMDCQDRVKDKVTANMSEEDNEKLRLTFEKCVVKCADSHVGLIPAMFKRMKEVLKH